MTSYSDEERELVIAGAGPAGISAALMALSLGLRPWIVDLQGVGGRLHWIGKMLNVPGFRTGTEMSRALEQQAEDHNLELLRTNVSGVEPISSGLRITCGELGKEIFTRILIWAAGLSPRGVAEHPHIEQHGDIPSALLTLPSYDYVAQAAMPLVIGGDRPLATFLRSNPDVAPKLHVLAPRSDKYKLDEILSNFQGVHVDYFERLELQPTAHGVSS